MQGKKCATVKKLNFVTLKRPTCGTVCNPCHNERVEAWKQQVTHPLQFTECRSPPKTQGTWAQWLHKVSTVWFIYTSHFYGFWSTPRFVLCTLSCWGWRGQKGQHICLEHTSKPSAPSAHVGLCAAARAIHHLSTQQADVKPFSPFAESVLF